MRFDILYSNKSSEIKVNLLLYDFSAYHFLSIFSSNLTTQKQAWQKVSEMMCLEGHHFTGEECDRKFRSLKMRQVAHVLYTFSCWPICMFFVLSIILMKVKTTKCDAHLFPCNWSNWFFLWLFIDLKVAHYTLK